MGKNKLSIPRLVCCAFVVYTHLSVNALNGCYVLMLQNTSNLEFIDIHPYTALVNGKATHMSLFCACIHHKPLLQITAGCWLK